MMCLKTEESVSASHKSSQRERHFMCLKTESSVSPYHKSSQRERIFWSDDASQKGGRFSVRTMWNLTGWCAQTSVFWGRCKVHKLWRIYMRYSPAPVRARPRARIIRVSLQNPYSISTHCVFMRFYFLLAGCLLWACFGRFFVGTWGKVRKFVIYRMAFCSDFLCHD